MTVYEYTLALLGTATTVFHLTTAQSITPFFWRVKIQLSFLKEHCVPLPTIE
jgi:hypothetical protein